MTPSILAASLAIALVTPTPAQPTAPQGFVVHEWGTFNQMQGADGVGVDGMQHEDEALPDFVHARFERTPSPFRASGDDSCLVRASRTNTKMETPVLYFYSEEARRVRVDVSYTNGLMTEWFPAAQAEPALPPGKDAWAPRDIAQVKTSRLTWDIDVLARGDRPRLPDVHADEPWALARVDAANRVRHRESGETEGYLFYRGLGSQQAMPLTVQPSERARTFFTTSPLAGAVVVEIEGDGRGGRMATLGKLEPLQPRTLAFDAMPYMTKDALLARARADVRSLLIAQGLFADEADAMVKTWSRTWFDKPGRRVLYIVPDAIVDALLPLSIEPKPDALVRVLVGRLEYQTEEDYDDLMRAVVAGDKHTLAARGRFLEPSLRVALRRERTPERRAPVIRVLRELMSARNE